MRDELVRIGVTETRTPEAVDQILNQSGTVLMIVNSFCGCAAGRARPAVAMALQHPKLPNKIATVFAGGDLEATARVRELASEFPPSSPSMILFRDGKPVYMMHRRDIEPRVAPEIADILKQAFDEHCA
jgi:putative YphP/YqiW family bacilliredoxin